MRRGLLGVVLFAAAILVSGGSATAATTTTHVRFHGLSATAELVDFTDSSFTDAFVNVSHTNKGDRLVVDLTESTATGETDYTVDTTSGFTAYIQPRTFSTASVTASGLRVRKCVFDENFNRTCTHTTIDLNAHWKAAGPIVSQKSHDSFSVKGFKETFSSVGKFRDASATATIAGISFTPQRGDFAQVGVSRNSEFTVCHGTSC